MNDYQEEFNAAKAGEVAVGVFVALVAFKVVKGILRASLE